MDIIPSFYNGNIDIGAAMVFNYCINIEIKPTPGVEFKTGEIVAQQAALLWQHEEVPPLLSSFQVESLKKKFYY